jgi:hypothetical protein
MVVVQPVWAEWEALGIAGRGTPEEFFSYVAPATVRKTPNGRRAWVMSSFKKPQTSASGTFQSAKDLVEFNCAGEQLRTLQLIWHSGEFGGGSVVTSYNDPDPWQVVSPGSVNEARLKAVCSAPLK